eukprot:CAMPEP_0184858922 /NCGR_PEP_ID=MMETSP0580-20130426/3949_1 /TAXON_ID=1118495 /ORGANISM="Dactyliosolen fragilissimus" /LENGTH=739 /DNA_ID=CAMNT_0027355283 /DNA_START=1 /DNA_END=2220 /DNA_ORIENTATION=-
MTQKSERGLTVHSLGGRASSDKLKDGLCSPNSKKINFESCLFGSRGPPNQPRNHEQEISDETFSGTTSSTESDYDENIEQNLMVSKQLPSSDASIASSKTQLIKNSSSSTATPTKSSSQSSIGSQPPPRPIKSSSRSTSESSRRNLRKKKSKRRKSHLIDIQNLRRLSSQGIPESTPYRAVAWRVLLGYLPPESDKWEEVLNRDRNLYRNLVSELFVCPHKGKCKNDDGKCDSINEHEGRHLTGRGVEMEGRSVRGQQFIIRSDSSMEDEHILDTETKLEEHENMNDKKVVSDIQDQSMIPESQEESDKTVNSLPLKESIQVDDLKSGENSTYSSGNINEEVKSGSDVQIADTRRSSNNWNLNALQIGKIDDNSTEQSKDKADESFKEIITEVADVNSESSKSHANKEKHSQFNENTDLLEEIRKDVVRTHPDLQFFLEARENLGQRRYAAIERILFIWAKLNKGVRYVQGMNEIVGTMYFVLANDSNKEWASEAEADTYFLFNTLMVEMRDIFVPDLDDADTGIQGRMANMIALLSLHDPEVRCHLDDCGIDPAFYSIRWLTTILSREFFLPDTIRMWDSMFASTHKDNFMRYVCVTMVMMIREDLLKADFGKCLRLLQSYPPTNVDQLLESSRALWIYESQITLACHKGGISLPRALTAITPPPAVIMAYGLSGGIAPEKYHPTKDAPELQKSSIRNTVRDANMSMASTMATASKSLLGSARGFFGLSKGSGQNKSA